MAGFAVFLIIVLIAASPLIALFVFSQVMSARENGGAKDTSQKVSKGVAWTLFIAVSVFLLYGLVSGGLPQHLAMLFKFVMLGMEFLK